MLERIRKVNKDTAAAIHSSNHYITQQPTHGIANSRMAMVASERNTMIHMSSWQNHFVIIAIDWLKNDLYPILMILVVQYDVRWPSNHHGDFVSLIQPWIELVKTDPQGQTITDLLKPKHLWALVLV